MWYQTDIDSSKLSPIATGTLWVNPATGLIYYYNSNRSKWTIADKFPALQCSGGVSYPFLASSRKWNSNFYFYTANQSYFLWYSGSAYGWVLSTSLGGAIDISNTWWKCSTFLGTYAPQGAASGNVSFSWSSSFGQYERATAAGRFDAASGSDKKFFGRRIMQLSGVFGSFHERFDKTFEDRPYFTSSYAGFPTAGWILKYASTPGGYCWTFSKDGDLTGLVYPYWTCATLNGSYARVWNGTDEALAALPAYYRPATITVSTYSWDAGSSSKTEWMCEVSHFLTVPR